MSLSTKRFSHAIVAVGIAPNTENLGLEAVILHVRHVPGEVGDGTGDRIEAATRQLKVVRVEVETGEIDPDATVEEPAPSEADFRLTRFILSCCPPGGTVVDIFGGSGTTAHAAIIHGRNAIHVDIRYMLWVMKEVDGADNLLKEMTIKYPKK